MGNRTALQMGFADARHDRQRQPVSALLQCSHHMLNEVKRGCVRRWPIGVMATLRSFRARLLWACGAEPVFHNGLRISLNWRVPHYPKQGVFRCLTQS